MDQQEDVLNQAGAGEVLDQVGISPETSESEVKDVASLATPEDPLSIKKRLGQQAKRHQKEMREMHAKLQALESRQQNPNPNQGYQDQGSIDPDEDARIQRAVSMALKARHDEERAMEEREKHQHVQKQYQNLHDQLDNAHDKYDDFHETVMANDVPFTDAMRDTSLLLPNAAEVLYKLGKNRPELERISKLHPLEQSKEMIKLSHALIGGATKSASTPAQTVGQIKSNPVLQSSVNEKTPVGELRRKMKANWR